MFERGTGLGCTAKYHTSQLPPFSPPTRPLAASVTTQCLLARLANFSTPPNAIQSHNRTPSPALPPSRPPDRRPIGPAGGGHFRAGEGGGGEEEDKNTCAPCARGQKTDENARVIATPYSENTGRVSPPAPLLPLFKRLARARRADRAQERVGPLSPRIALAPRARELCIISAVSGSRVGGIRTSAMLRDPRGSRPRE